MTKKITLTHQKETYYKCTHCGDEIFWNTHKNLTFCKCKKIAIDGCEYYVRINGNKEDYKVVKKLKQTKIIKTAGKGKNTAYIAN